MINLKVLMIEIVLLLAASILYISLLKVKPNTVQIEELEYNKLSVEIIILSIILTIFVQLI